MYSHGNGCLDPSWPSVSRESGEPRGDLTGARQPPTQARGLTTFCRPPLQHWAGAHGQGSGVTGQLRLAGPHGGWSTPLLTPASFPSLHRWGSQEHPGGTPPHTGLCVRVSPREPSLGRWFICPFSLGREERPSVRKTNEHRGGKGGKD